MALVSIIIPICKTQKKEIKRAIESVINQTYENIQVLIIDDSPTGTMSSEALKYIHEVSKKDSRINYISLGNNLGLVEARRTGVECASGDYIMFLDSDDELASCETVQTMLNIALETNADIIQGRGEIYGLLNNLPLERQEKLIKSLANSFVGVLEEKLLYNQFCEGLYPWFLWGKLYKKDLLIAVFQNIPNIYCVMLEDLLISFLISNYAKKYVGIPDLVYRYFIGVGMTSSKKKINLEEWEALCSASSAFTAILYWIKENPQEEIIVKELFGIAFNTIRRHLEILENFQDFEMKKKADKILIEYWGEEIIQRIKSEKND